MKVEPGELYEDNQGTIVMVLNNSYLTAFDGRVFDVFVLACPTNLSQEGRLSWDYFDEYSCWTRLL